MPEVTTPHSLIGDIIHSLGWPFFNFSVLVGLLVWKLRDPVRGFVRQRHETLRDEIDSVRDLLKRSQERFSEFSNKLQMLDLEVATIRSQMKQDAQAMNARISEDAKKQSVRISADARTAAQGLLADMRSGLYHELAIKVLERAETLLRERLTGDDRARIRQEFSRQVEVVQ
jgi:F0F1-type ATP synthase membrane subunit b/b'